MKVLISLSLLFMMIHVSLAGPFFKSQKQNKEYSQCSDKSNGRQCRNPNAQTQIRRSDAKSHSRDTELSSAGNEGRSVPVGAKVTRSIAGQSARSSSGRERRSATMSSSAPSQSQATLAARVQSSRHERLPSDHEEELIEEDEVLVAELRSILDEMSASEFLELANDISEEDLIDDEEDEEVSSDVTDSAPENADLRSRTKRSIVFLLKKHLLKGHIRRKLLGAKLRHKARKLGHAARGAAGHAVRLGILGAGAAGLGGLAGVGYSSANNN